MEVKQCLECGGEVEEWERTCPHCGSNQNPLITRLLIGAIVLAGCFVAWQYLFPERKVVRLQPGTPVLSRPESPACMTEDILDVYRRLIAKKSQDDADRVLSQGCVTMGENVPLTVLTVKSSGIVLVQGFHEGHAANFWIQQEDLKPYRTR